MKKKIILSIILALYLLGLFFGATVIKLNSFPIQESDKFLHFASFFLLSILLILTLRAYGFKNALSLSFLSSAAIAILIEVIQLLIPKRSFSILDFVAGLGGAILGVSLIWIFSKR